MKKGGAEGKQHRRYFRQVKKIRKDGGKTNKKYFLGSTPKNQTPSRMGTQGKLKRVRVLERPSGTATMRYNTYTITPKWTLQKKYN